MSVAASTGATHTSRLIQASRTEIFRAFTDPVALASWLVPGEMTGEVHAFDLRVGGGYQMSLYYPASETAMQGKSGGREDRYWARFVEISPPERLVTAITFDTTDPAFGGEMTMIVGLSERADGTEVTIAFENLPPGIRPEDNDAGTRSSLAKLAAYVEGGQALPPG